MGVVMDKKKDFRSNFYELKEMASKISAIIKQAIDPIEIAWKKSKEQYAEQMESIVEGLKNLPEEVKTAQRKLMEQGWYMPDNISIPNIRSIKDMTDEEIEEMMFRYAKFEFTELRKRVEENFPKRRYVLESAFKAHEEGIYNLCIPVFLAQADGMANDIFAEPAESDRFTNVSMFRTRKGKPDTADRWKSKMSRNIDRDSVTYQHLFSPLDAISNIQENTRVRDARNKNTTGYSLLNRHGVIHGIDVDYGTEGNSLRCIMILSYIISLNEYFMSHSRKC